MQRRTEKIRFGMVVESEFKVSKKNEPLRCDIHLGLG
jgi:hypothetical protein